MKVTRLEVNAFRNLSAIELEAHDGVNVIYGENGQGKTNIIEAIWLFTGSKSFRGAGTSELVPLGGVRSDISLDYHDGVRENRLRMIMGDKKEISQNAVTLSSAAELCGGFCCVVFSPVHLNLIKGSPSERRKLIDMIIGQLKPRYLSVLSEYQRILLQRNTLLKDIQFSSSLLDTLEIWDQSLAKKGALITKTRQSFIERLKPLCSEFYGGISNGKESFDMSYQSNIEADGEISELTMAAALKAARAEDIRNGTTSAGPHRDDIMIDINGISARSFGSQGQQRSGVLAIKLGEAALMNEILGQTPVILLDDVMSELDDSRRDFLLHRLEDKQIFITCCDPNQIFDVDRSFKVAAGRIVEVI